MFSLLKKHGKLLFILFCILLTIAIYHDRRVQKAALTGFTDLQQVCEILNLSMTDVCPEGAVEHDFSAEVHQGRGLYTVEFRPSQYTKADYETWMTGLKDASRQVSIGGKLLKVLPSQGTYSCSTRWYLVQQHGPDANVIVSWDDGDFYDGFGTLEVVFELY